MHELVPSGSPVGVSIFSSLLSVAPQSQPPNLRLPSHFTVALLVSCSIARQFAGGLEVKQK
jgi:hypothetical protein